MYEISVRVGPLGPHAEKTGLCTRKSGLQASCTTSYFVLKANNGWHDTREPYLAVRTPDSRDEVNKGEQTWQRKIFEELYRYEVKNQVYWD